MIVQCARARAQAIDCAHAFTLLMKNKRPDASALLIIRPYNSRVKSKP